MRILVLFIIFTTCVLIQCSLIFGFIDYEPNEIRLFVIIVFWVEIISGAMIIDTFIKDFEEF